MFDKLSKRDGAFLFHSGEVITVASARNMFDQFPKRYRVFLFRSIEVIIVISMRNMFDKLPKSDHDFLFRSREVITVNAGLQHISTALAIVHFLNAIVTTWFATRKPLEALIIMFSLGETRVVCKLAHTGLITIPDYINLVVLLIVGSTYLLQHKSIDLPSQLC